MASFGNMGFFKDQKAKQQAAPVQADNVYGDVSTVFGDDFQDTGDIFKEDDTFGQNVVTPASTASTARKKTQQTAAGSAVTKVRIMKPKAYEDVYNIASKLIEGYIVSMNLECVGTESEIKDIMTFLAGVVFAIHAETVPVSEQVWLLYPKNLVQLSKEEDEVEEN